MDVGIDMLSYIRIRKVPGLEKYIGLIEPVKNYPISTKGWTVEPVFPVFSKGWMVEPISPVSTEGWTAGPVFYLLSTDGWMVEPVFPIIFIKE